MRENSEASITLVGTTDNKDAERDNEALSQARTDVIKKYFVERWDIDSSRIHTATQQFPDKPTNPEYAEGDEENRRVEINTDDPSLFRPVVHENFTEYSMTPPTMTFSLGATAEAGVEGWSLTARGRDHDLVAFSGEGAPPPSFSWKLQDSTARAVRDTDSIICALTIRDKHGKSTTSRSNVAVFKSKNSVEVGRLSLVVFDFDKTDIIEANRKMIERFVVDGVHPNSTVSIIGSTDRLGEADHNLELSAGRANRVKQILLKGNPNANVIECKGIGMSKLLYDNSLPEGRYYCRTVAIEVKTPVQ